MIARMIGIQIAACLRVMTPASAAFVGAEGTTGSSFAAAWLAAAAIEIDNERLVSIVQYFAYCPCGLQIDLPMFTKKQSQTAKVAASLDIIINLSISFNQLMNYYNCKVNKQIKVSKFEFLGF